MTNSLFHNGDLVQVSEMSVENPQQAYSWFKRHDGKHGYDIMIGTTCYNVKSVKYTNNDTELITKITLKKGQTL